MPAGTSTGPGSAGVVTPDDPIEVIESVARAYRARWLVVERERRGAGARAGAGRRRGRRGSGRRSSRSPHPDGGAAAARALSRLHDRGRHAVRVPADAASQRHEPRSAREPPRGASCRPPSSSSSRSSCAPGRRRRSPSRGRRTSRTTSAWRGTSSRGAGLVTDAIWSFQTPPLSFPRPAFEVWLPLPSLLAAIPMAILGTTFAAAQVSSVVVGSLVCVLAWRLAADVAAAAGDADRSRADARGRDGARQRGLPAARPRLGPARLDDAVRGARPRARCLLITRLSRRISLAGRRDEGMRRLHRPDGAGPRAPVARATSRSAWSSPSLP